VQALAGSPAPLGVTLQDDGVNAAVYSCYATQIDFCLFDETGARETARIALPERSGDVWHGFVPGVRAGARYGLRAHGEWSPRDGHRFNAAKLLIDPYAKALDGRILLHEAMFTQTAAGGMNPEDSAHVVPKAIVLAPAAPWDPERPHRPWSESVVYEMHVRGFTKQHPGVPLPLRGTLAGLAHPAALDHLVKLGVTAVELLPIAAAVDERHLMKLGLTNYWGYNTIGWMLPDPALAPGGIAEVRHCVEALHAAGIEVLLDVVLNHSGESDAMGPTLSLRGLDNATYYRLVPGHAERDINDTGTGNTLALDRPPVTQLALDTLRYWASAAGVDGFRYDLATTLARRDHGFDASAPLLKAIDADPLLRTLKHIAEPWDIGPGGYQLGAFPAAWGEWNDKFRDRVRRYWQGAGDSPADLATRLAGSPDIFRGRGRPPSRSVNFVTAHDGFTLADLVSYSHKHNEANGERNRDGTDANHSWNHGAEGPTDDPRIAAARQRDARALLATLLCARGTPMLCMGDEMGRSQRGNNNAYAQDNTIAWVDWGAADQGQLAFTTRMLAVRQRYGVLREDRWLTGGPRRSGASEDVRWLRADGQPASESDWASGRMHVLVALLSDAAELRVVVCLNPTNESVGLRLPAAGEGRHWVCVMDTAADPLSFSGVPLGDPQNVILPERAVLVFAEATATEAGMTIDADQDQGTQPMRFPRAAGLLLHPTSLPGTSGIGDLGPEAHNFIEFMADAGIKLWQVLPLGPTGYGDSPYQCFSAFAGNPMLVHVPDSDGDFDADQVEWARVIPHKRSALRRATAAMPTDAAYSLFVSEQAWWLEDYALFMALKEAHGGVEWTRWDEGTRRRDPAALAEWRERLAEDIEHHRRVQHLFFQQWRSVQVHCAEKGIRIMGDLPIYVSHDSADVWAAPQYFLLSEEGRPTVQAGVPPDYFSATGQLWGNPIYDWAAMEADGFAWWIRRTRAMFTMVDVVRVDHFRGFAAYWEVPGEDRTAINGRWVKAPGDALFTAITQALGPLPIVAENLGLITDDVEALRAKFGYPGMSILQFAFGADGGANDFQPHTYPRERVVYTGTHDNDTVVGWWNSMPGADSTRTQETIDAEKAFACRYLGTDGHEIHWTMIRAALASVADTAILPMQDLLGLGSESRMNLPGRQAGNWGFRFTWDEVRPDTVTRLREMVALYQR
jgi:glycogen debranching enzyme GlgX/4-alpha-glucanotransferase